MSLKETGYKVLSGCYHTYTVECHHASLYQRRFQGQHRQKNTSVSQAHSPDVRFVINKTNDNKDRRRRTRRSHSLQAFSES